MGLQQLGECYIDHIAPSNRYCARYYIFVPFKGDTHLRLIYTRYIFILAFQLELHTENPKSTKSTVQYMGIGFYIDETA